jgi:hypothetical protein
MASRQKRSATSSAPPRRSAEHSAGMTDDQITRAAALLGNVDEASKYLPTDEREALDRAQQSVVDARRHADIHEGHLRVF